MDGEIAPYKAVAARNLERMTSYDVSVHNIQTLSLAKFGSPMKCITMNCRIIANIAQMFFRAFGVSKRRTIRMSAFGLPCKSLEKFLRVHLLVNKENVIPLCFCTVWRAFYLPLLCNKQLIQRLLNKDCAIQLKMRIVQRG